MSAEHLSRADENKRREHRTNLFVSVALVVDNETRAARLRNLSVSGALIELLKVPEEGKIVTLRRGDLEVSATVLWTGANRCGVHFENPIILLDWLGNSRPRRQQDVDDAVNKLKSGVIPRSRAAQTLQDPSEIKLVLHHRIGEELAYVARILDDVATDLLREPIVVSRHARKLQNFDIATLSLGHLAAILQAQDQAEATLALNLDSLRSRLLRKNLDF